LDAAVSVILLIVSDRAELEEILDIDGVYIDGSCVFQVCLQFLRCTEHSTVESEVFIRTL
jgi:hypothetical protein